MIQMKQWLMNLPIRKVLMILLFPFFLVLIFSCLIFYNSGANHYSELVKENAWSLAEQSKNALNRDVENIQETAYGLLNKNAFYLMDYNIEKGESPLTPTQYMTMSTNFTEFLQHYSVYVDFAAMWLSDNSIYYYKSNANTSEYGSIRNLEYTSYLSQTDEPIWVDIWDLLPKTAEENNFCRFGILQTIGTADSAVNGFFLLGIRNEMFFDKMENSKVTNNSSMVLVKQDGEMISGTDTAIQLSEKDMKKLKVESATSFETDSNYIVYTPVGINRLGLLTIIPTDEMYLGYREFMHVFIFFIVAVIVVYIVLYFIVPGFFSKPVKRLLKQMQSIDNPDAEQKIDVNGYREINQIAVGINEMVDRIRLLTQSIQKEMTAKQATQLQYLFAQINPHFLYNALDCIRELCTCNENKKAEEMISQLVVFYRIGVSKGQSFILIEEEMQHVSSYLAILQTRFEDFTYQIEVPEELKKCRVIRMILQPIVENAVYHGIRPCRTDGTVEVKAERMGDMIFIHVKDDGTGISEDVLTRIRQSLSEPIGDYEKKSYGIYGIKNVQDRIQLAYGSEYGIRIETQPDYGTDVVVILPYCQDENLEGKEGI